MSRRLRASWLSALAAAALLTSPVSAQPQPADFIVAVVNSEPITRSEVLARSARLEQQLAQSRTPVPPRAQLTRQVLERLISERAQLQFARQVGIKVEEAAVDEAEQNLARQNSLDLAQLRARLTADGISPAALREDLRNQILIARLREREVEPRVRVSEQEIDQFLREQTQAAAAEPVELNLAQILVAVPENASADQVQALAAKAQRLRAQALAGEDFSALARQFSDAPGAATQGGVFGLRPADRYPSLFVDAVARLPVAGISELLRSGAGFHVLKLIEKREASPFAVVQSRARHILLRVGPQLSEPAALQQLADFKRRIDAGQADFAALARDHSQDGSAAAGGDLGWSKPGMFVPEFESVMNAQAPGGLAEPFVSRFGAHLVQLLERRQVIPSAREQRDIARNALREKKGEEAYRVWAQDVRSRAYVDVRAPPQ